MRAQVAYYPFNGNADDESGNGNHGTVYGAILTDDRMGNIDSAYSFDGVDDYIDIGNPDALRITGSQSIVMWIRPVDFNARRNPFAKAYGGEGTITIETNGQVNYFYGSCGGNCTPYQGFTMTSSLQVDIWAQLVIVRDLNSMKLKWYKDGILTNETDALYSAAVAGSLSAYIGKGYVNNFKGLIDDVSIYNSALSDAEILTLYNGVGIYAPEITPINDQAMYEGETLSVPVIASDADGEYVNIIRDKFTLLWNLYRQW